MANRIIDIANYQDEQVEKLYSVHYYSGEKLLAKGDVMTSEELVSAIEVVGKRSIKDGQFRIFDIGANCYVEAESVIEK